MVPRVPQHLLNAALKKLTLLLAAATLINEAKRKKNAPLKLLPDRTFVATRAREELKTVSVSYTHLTLPTKRIV